MRAILLGGAPGVGKSRAAKELLFLAASGTELLQWVDVDHLWQHQPWRVDDATTSLVRNNLRAVLANAKSAGVDVVLVTWVFQNTAMHQLVASLLPEHTLQTSVQLLAEPATWRHRFERDPDRPPVDEFFEQRYGEAQTTAADHLIQTDGLKPIDVAHLIASLIGM